MPTQLPKESGPKQENPEAVRLEKLSFFENLKLTLSVVLPMTLQGTFTRNAFWVGFFGRFHPDPMGIRFYAKLRRKHKSPYLQAKLTGTKTIIVLDEPAIREVLDRSPMTYADPKTKRVGMSHFQPNALTISRGDEWLDRRRFNVAVVGCPQGGHSLEDHIRRICREEAQTTATKQTLGWEEFDELFGRIMRQVVFGGRAKDDTLLTDQLRAMMKESNKVLRLLKRPYKSELFDSFYGKVRGYLMAAPPDCLAGLCNATASTEATKVENQIPHWMFAMHETLAINCLRCLALIRQEREDLAGCLQETMRLWPTTPILMREALKDDIVNGVPVQKGDQVLIPNHFLHRDKETYADADKFNPQFWAKEHVDFRFNHLSNGTQVCAGKDLALFMGVEVLSALLEGRRYEVLSPHLNPARLPYSLNHFKIKLRVV